MSGREMSAMGLSVVAPSGWDAAIYRRAPEDGTVTYPVVHAATVALPTQRGDYGSGLVELLGPEDVFVGVLEFGPEAAETPLFSALTAVPGLTPDSYRPRQLQRTILGQAGVQRFFTVGGRAFCLYSVVGAWTNRAALSQRANLLIGSLRISPVGS